MGYGEFDMVLSRLDCHFFRGGQAQSDRSSYVALNPGRHPGSMVLAVSCAARESIGSQVACRLSIEHFVDGVLGYFQKWEASGFADDNSAEVSLKILEAAFRNANTSVYSFGHKLAAGGRMAASLLGLVIEDRVIAAGRAGGSCAYLYRKGELFPFFEGRESSAEPVEKEDFVGENSLVSVELASVPVQEEDVIYVFGEALTSDKESELLRLSSEMDFSVGNPCWEISQFLFDEPEGVPVAMLARVGPEVIYLDQPLVVNG